MKIKLNDFDAPELVVLGIYWAPDRSTGEQQVRHYSFLESEDQYGLSVTNENRAIVTSPEIHNFIFFKNDLGNENLIHRACYDKNGEFYHELIECRSLFEPVDVLLDNLEMLEIEHGFERIRSTKPDNYYKKFAIEASNLKEIKASPFT